MSRQDQDRTPWVTIFSGCVAVTVFLLALDHGLVEAGFMAAVAFVAVFVPVGLLALFLERWHR